jgi:hypothetical protein
MLTRKNGGRMWTVPEPKGITRTTTMEAESLKLVSEGCGDEIVGIFIYDMINSLSFHVFNWWLDSGISSCFRHSFMLLI